MDTLWQKITEADQQQVASQQPLVKSQFRLKKGPKASTPKAKIPLGPEMHYHLEAENNSLVIGKNEKTFQLKLNDSENMIRWADALTKIGIHEKGEEKENFLEEEALAAPWEEAGSSRQKRDLYAAPETYKPTMEHFIINANQMTKRSRREVLPRWAQRQLEKIPEEQELIE